jgi:uncharacterized OB-fold protein
MVPVRAGLFDVDDDRLRLRAGRCGACGSLQFPRADTCSTCGQGDVADVLLTGEGSNLWAWTSVRAAPPGYRGPVPYGFGVVELVEGLRVVTRLTEADPDRLRFGQPMRLVADPLHIDDDGATVLTWAFAPVDP